MNDGDKHRKRLRGYAGFFVAIGALQLISGLILLSPTAETSSEQAWGYCLSGVFYIAGALAAWNGARSGAIAILVWIVGNCALEVALGEAGAVFFVRYAVFALLAARMTIHAFRYWAAIRASDEDRVRGLAVLRWSGLAVMVPIFVLSAFGAQILLGPMPVSDRILTSSTIPSAQIDWMRENRLLTATETPLLFYSEGIMSIAEGGNILTDRFLGSWSQLDDGERTEHWIRLGEICDVSVLEAEDAFGIAKYHARGIGDVDPMEFWLPAGDPLHDTFLERLDYLNSHLANAELTSACEENRAPDWTIVSRLNGLPGGMVEAADIPQEILNWLRGEEFLFAGEEPLWLFSNARYDLAEGGVLMSDAYFGGWWDKNGIQYSLWFQHGEICKIDMLEDEATETMARYRVSGADDEEYLNFSLPLNSGRTDARLAELEQFTRDGQTQEQADACAARADNAVEQVSVEDADAPLIAADEEET